MFRKTSLTILFFIFTSIAFAQSGRIKPSEKPTPTPRPHIVYLPTEAISNAPKPQTTPTPTPKIDEDEGDVIRVNTETGDYVERV